MIQSPLFRVVRAHGSGADGAGSAVAYRDSYVYDGAHILLEFRDPDASGSQPSALRSRLLHGPVVDQLLAEEQFAPDGSSTTYWPLVDWLGSTRDLVDSSGAVRTHIDYDSFGNVSRVTNGSGQASTLDSAPSTRFLWTGREWDSETGLQYNRARYYDAAIGRWLSEDPIGFGGGDTNLYRYVSNSATNLTDPSGLIEEPPRPPGPPPRIDPIRDHPLFPVEPFPGRRLPKGMADQIGLVDRWLWSQGIDPVTAWPRLGAEVQEFALIKFPMAGGGNKGDGESAGINRHGVADERAAQERSSAPSWPRVWRRRP